MMSKVDTLKIKSDLDGSIWFHRASERQAMGGEHSHQELEMNLVLTGRARLLFRDRTYILAPNALAWMFPGQPHLLIDRSPDFAMWTAVFHPRMYDRIHPASDAFPFRREDPDEHLCRRLLADDAERLARMLRELGALDLNTGQSIFNSGLLHWLLIAWARFSSGADILPADILHPAVERALTALQGPHPPQDLSALARHAGMSANHLGQLLRTQTDMGFNALRNQVRLNRFFVLFARHPERTMLDAALAAGFGSYAQFHRVFKAQQGQSPRAWHTESGTA